MAGAFSDSIWPFQASLRGFSALFGCLPARCGATFGLIFELAADGFGGRWQRYGAWLIIALIIRDYLIPGLFEGYEFGGWRFFQREIDAVRAHPSYQQRLLWAACCSLLPSCALPVAAPLLSLGQPSAAMVRRASSEADKTSAKRGCLPCYAG